jgi:predicted dienelactone hydrolase
MGPAYLVTIYVFLTWSWPRIGFVRRRWLALCGIGLLAGAAAMGTALPVFELPKPTGAYPIGTVTVHLIDPAREETHGDRAGAHRELMVQIWYPAARSGPGQEYRKRAEVDFKKEHLALVRTHAATAVPMAAAQSRYPVVIFSPAWVGRRDQNTVQAEELASHGFVVIGIDHPYGTDWTVFPDGRAVPSALGNALDYSSDEALETSIRKAEEELRIRAADVRLVVKELERQDLSGPEGLFTDRLDTSRMGIFGHSFGGAVAAEICRTDSQFRAGIDMDGILFGEATRTGIGKPFLVMGDGSPGPTPDQLRNSKGSARRALTFLARDHECIRRCLESSRGILVSIPGTSHLNFCDSPLYSPVKRLTHAGPIRRERAMDIINAFVVSFFEIHLNGKDETYLDSLSSRYPEVVIERPAKGTL